MKARLLNSEAPGGKRHNLAENASVVDALFGTDLSDLCV